MLFVTSYFHLKNPQDTYKNSWHSLGTHGTKLLAQVYSVIVSSSYTRIYGTIFTELCCAKNNEYNSAKKFRFLLSRLCQARDDVLFLIKLKTLKGTKALEANP